ncbi:MAG: hypothetical protein AB1772_08005 [Candidatus Zixiibacteriota bacterium]
MRVWLMVIALALSAHLINAEGSGARMPGALGSQDEGDPQWDGDSHGLGRLVLSVGNSGGFGPAIYPKGSYKEYLAAGWLVIGAIQGEDTLAQSWFEPAVAPRGRIIVRSSLDPSLPWYDSTAAHHDCIAVYYDTCTDCGYHPLNVEVTERSRSWGYEYSQDIVLFDYSVKNIGTERLRQIFIGIYADGDVSTTLPGLDTGGVRDDMVGFLERYPAVYLDAKCPVDTEQVNIAWTADNDGNMRRIQPETHVLDITGIKFIRAPRDSMNVTFNWWATGWRWDPYHDFGPQARATYRPLASGLMGTPQTEEEWYHFLSNGERDYDQAYQATMRSFDATWVQPPDTWIDSVNTGLDPRYLISIGPFGLDPGQTLQFTTAFVAAMSFHRHNQIHRFLPDNPYGWYERVYFELLARNALWAEWIYDNPGVDTDFDGYAGEFTVCDLDRDSVWLCDTLVDSSADPDTNYIACRWEYGAVDTVWRKGDGVPDFRGAFPPPNPSTTRLVSPRGDTIPAMRVYPETGKIRLVWNGAATENSIDPFLHRNDFEGYSVYLAYDSRPTSFSLVTTYDHENYNRWIWNKERRSFVCYPTPYTLEQLRCMHADSCNDTTWRPEPYHRDNPLIVPGGPKGDDAVFYFEPCGPNRSILANDPINANTGIRKVYPNAVKPAYTDPDSMRIYYTDPDDTTYFTPEGYFKYYEYEYVFDNILPTQVYYVNVTAFDYGYPGLGLSGVEGDPANLPKAVYPLPSSEVIKEQGLGVFVYPNPYRLDGDYRELGYEAILRWHLPEDKTRLIHFANLPPRCTISIFSLDGDLIRELKHDVDPEDYLANHATWDLINRNMQLVVTGLYYWVVEDDRGNVQIGKLVIIM